MWLQQRLRCSWRSTRSSPRGSTRARPRAPAQRSRWRSIPSASTSSIRRRATTCSRPLQRTPSPRRCRSWRRDDEAAVTKQSQTREQVLDLIERLTVGEAIPSERQLSADFGVSRLTVRAALDELVREGHLVRRRGAGTFVSEPKIAQELTLTSFTDDMRQHGLHAASRTLEFDIVTAGARLGRLLHVSPSEPIV